MGFLGMRSAGAGGFIAHDHDRPVTAALAFVFAVVLVAIRYGLLRHIDLTSGVMMSCGSA